MKTIGQTLKDARVRKRYSRARLEKVTKIKKSFIEAIEKEEWQALPEYPVVAGFAKSIALALKLDKQQVIAVLRRDYPPQKLSINPKPDISNKFTWSPKLTFVAGAVLVSLIVLGYLGYQYVNFISPPNLEVDKPRDGEVVVERRLEVIGKTDPDVVIKINNQPVLIEETGEFTTEIEIYEGTSEIEVKAISRSGKETVVRRKIVPELD